MKKIFVIALSLIMLASVSMAGSRKTLTFTEILDLGECTDDRKRCVVAEVIHPKYKHLMQFIDKDKDGIPDYAWLFQMTINPASGKIGLVERGKVRQSPQESVDIINDICAQYGVAEDECIQYSDSFTGWEKIEGE